MKTWLVDTNVLLDVIGADAIFGQASSGVLASCAEIGQLVVNQIIIAELAVWIPTVKELEAALPQSLFRRESLPWEGAYLASQAFGRYKRAGGNKSRMLADFLIGAHAAVSGHALISRDRGYSRYFDIELLNPAANF